MTAPAHGCDPAHVRPRRATRVVAALLVLVACLAVLELGLRLPRLDARMVARALYYQAVDTPVHRASDDPLLVYELRPGGRVQNVSDYGPYVVTINAHGARGPELPAEKAPDVFRILFFGSSPVYGAHVNDDQTLPAALGRLLNASAPPGRRYEVWNYGTSAYNLGQNLHLARLRLARLEPDLVLVQLYNQTGQRAFPAPAPGEPPLDVAPFFRRDPRLYLENFPPPPGVPVGLHLAALEHVAAYRTLFAFLRAQRNVAKTESPFVAAYVDSELAGLVQESRARGTGLAFVQLPCSPGDQVPWLVRLATWLGRAHVVRVHRDGRERDFYRDHPPPPILREIAGLLADELLRAGVLPDADQRPVTR